MSWAAEEFAAVELGEVDLGGCGGVMGHEVNDHSMQSKPL